MLKTAVTFAISYLGIIVSRMFERILLDGTESMEMRALGVYVSVCLFYALGYAYGIVPVLDHNIKRKVN